MWSVGALNESVAPSAWAKFWVWQLGLLFCMKQRGKTRIVTLTCARKIRCRAERSAFPENLFGIDRQAMTTCTTLTFPHDKYLLMVSARQNSVVLASDATSCLGPSVWFSSRTLMTSFPRGPISDLFRKSTNAVLTGSADQHQAGE